MRITAACLLLFLIAPALYGQDQPRMDWQPLEKIFLDPALKTADLDAHAETLARLIEDSADLTALRRWQQIEAEVSNPKAVYQALAKLAEDDFRKCSAEADEFVEAYLKLARKFSGDLLWQSVSAKWTGVSQAAWVGPFADGSASVQDDVFSPEVMLDYAAEYSGVYGRLRWAPVKHVLELDSTLDLYEQQRWPGYGYYVTTTLVSDEERPALIKLKFSGPAKAWLGGECILDADSRRTEQPEEFFLRVTLRRGRNALLVKLSSVASVRIRLRDMKGQPLANVLAVMPEAKDKPTKIRSSKSTGTQPVLPEALLTNAAQAELAASLEDRKWYALLMLAGWLEADARGMSDRANEAAELALKAMPTDTLVQLAFLRATERGRFYSSSERRRLTRSMTEQLLQADPTLVPAQFEKAKLLASDERFREAFDLLTESLENTQARWRVYLRMAEVFRDANWRPEYERAIKSALREAPDSLPVLRAASEYYASIGAQDREIAMDRGRLKLLPGDPDAHLSLANTLARTGDIEGSLKHLRVLVAADPASEFLLERLGEALAADGNVSESLAVYEKLSARSANPESALYQAAKVCLQLGREELGVKYLERVVETDPGHHIARRELQRIRGESEDVWSQYSVSWEEVMKHDLTREQFPRADSAVILDEQIQYAYPDGSSVSYVHQVRKILTQEGVDARGKDRVSGELVTARTIQADGTVLEPITQPGGLIEYPGVKIGAYLEVAYLVRADGGPLQTLDGDTFYFMDQTLNEPFAISRWVLIAPKDKRLNVIYHNMRQGDKGVTISAEPADDRLVYTWDVRDPRMPERETFMPAPQEFIPWIECVHPRDWRMRAREVAEDGLREVMDTSLIREKAAELTKGARSDEAKARAIYRWLNATITTEGDSWNAHQALKSGAGDRRELFISLCAAAGLRLGFALVDAAPSYKTPPEESQARPHWAYPNKQDFEEFYIVLRGEEGADVYVNMEDRLRPFGEVPARRFNAPAILWREGEAGRPGDYELSHLPGGDREKDRFENRVTIILAEDGSAKLDGSITVHGERSYALKEDMRTTPNDELCNELEATLAQQYQGFEVDECVFPLLGEVGEPLVQGYSGSVRKLATKDADGLSLELPGEKLGRLMSILVGSRKRDSDIVINFDLTQTDEIRIRPPEGYAFSGVPDDLVYPTAPLMYELKFRVEEGELVVTRKLVLGPGRFRPEEYSDLVEQVKRVKQAEGSTLKLVKS